MRSVRSFALRQNRHATHDFAACLIDQRFQRVEGFARGNHVVHNQHTLALHQRRIRAVEVELLHRRGRNGLHFHADDILHVQLRALARQQPLLVAMLTSHFICQRNALRLRRDKVVIFRRFLEQLRRARHRQLTVAEDDKRANIQVVVHAANRQRALQPRDGHFMRQHNSVSPSLFPNCSGAFSCAFYNLLYREIPLLSIDFPTFLDKLARLYGLIRAGCKSCRRRHH